MTGIRTIGVIGAGQMGNGIAHVCALAGFDVLLTDISAEKLENGLNTIKRNLERQVHREMIKPDQRDAALKRIRTAKALGEFGDVRTRFDEYAKRHAAYRARDELPAAQWRERVEREWASIRGRYGYA